MAKPIVVALPTQKGGTGKTTTAVELAAYVSKQNKRVLCVDFDPQGSLSDVLDIEQETSATIYDVLLGKVSVADAVQAYTYDDASIDVIPANEALAYAGSALSENLDLLNDAIESTAGYDIVVIDCAPMPQTSMAFNALRAADWVVLPTNTERQATKSLTKTIKTIKAFMDANGGAPKVAGVLVCDHVQGTTMGKAWLRAVDAFCAQNDIRLIGTVVRHTVKVDEAQTAHAPVSMRFPRSTAGEDYLAACKQLMAIITQEEE